MNIPHGPWQGVSGSLAIAPVLDPTADWLEPYEGRFVKVHAGPDYVMLRRQILGVREGLQNPGKASKPEITLALGGTDSGGNSEWVIEALKSIDTPLKVTVFASAGSVATEHRQIGAHEFVFRKPGSAYASTLTTAALVIAAGGTSALELIYLGLPSIFLPVAENQYENAAAIEKLGLGALVWPKDPKRQEKLVHAVTSELRGPRPALIKGPIIDGHGVGRVADLLLEAW
jgi:spore coat polysaccharide biosynthesis predicted glycosyltransferase SpsG